MRFCNFLFHLCLRKICSLQEKKTWINCCRKLTLLSAPLISHHFSSRKIITYIFQICLWKMLVIVKNWKDPKHRKFYYIVRRGKIFVSWKSKSWILCYSTPLTWLCSLRTCCISNNSFRFGGMTRLTVYVRPFWRTLKYLLQTWPNLVNTGKGFQVLNQFNKSSRSDTDVG